MRLRAARVGLRYFQALKWVPSVLLTVAQVRSPKSSQLSWGHDRSQTVHKRRRSFLLEHRHLHRTWLESAEGNYLPKYHCRCYSMRQWIGNCECHDHSLQYTTSLWSLQPELVYISPRQHLLLAGHFHCYSAGLLASGNLHCTIGRLIRKNWWLHLCSILSVDQGMRRRWCWHRARHQGSWWKDNPF